MKLLVGLALFLGGCGSERPVLFSVTVNPSSIPQGGETMLTVELLNFTSR
jgi:hypothetical protein